MITLKQMEALYWVGTLKTFERASARLNTTQSAVSKRIQELELTVGVKLFDRSGRGAILTLKGEQMMVHAEEMLAVQQRAEAVASEGEQPPRRLRLGITELSALTWLPRLVSQLRRAFPAVLIEARVDNGQNLHTLLVEERLDIVVVPDIFGSPALERVPLAHCSSAWMASPRLVQPDGPMTLEQLAHYRIILQSSSSGTGLWMARWLRTRAEAFPYEVASDSLMALLGMTVAGLGVTYLPRDCFAPLVAEGKLIEIETDPPLPEIPYVAMHRRDKLDGFLSVVLEVAQTCCDFSTQLQDDNGEAP